MLELIQVVHTGLLWHRICRWPNLWQVSSSSHFLYELKRAPLGLQYWSCWPDAAERGTMTGVPGCRPWSVARPADCLAAGGNPPVMLILAGWRQWKGVLLLQDLHPPFVSRVRGSSLCPEAVPCPGRLLEPGGLTDHSPIPWVLPCQVWNSCLVSLLTSLCLNSVQTRAVMCPVLTELCYAKIAVSCSGSQVHVC